MTSRSVIRIRHEQARRRELTVAEKRFLTPNFLSIRFTCDDFADFVSASPDDHIKVFLPTGESRPSGKPLMRDYTPRSFDPESGEFVIEFALHDNAGPATRWALAARIGDKLQIGGPRGSVVIPSDYDWFWLIGDETAIPAITRRIEENPESAIHAFIAVAGQQEEVPLSPPRSHIVEWIHRPAEQAGNPGALEQAIRSKDLPQGEGFVWIAAEAAVAKAVRDTVLAKGHPAERLKARGYWVAGQADSTANFD